MSGLELKYFVLKPKSKTSHDVYAQASRKALRSYANHIQPVNPVLAEELRQWAGKETGRELEMRDTNGTLPKLQHFDHYRIQEGEKAIVRLTGITQQDDCYHDYVPIEAVACTKCGKVRR